MRRTPAAVARPRIITLAALAALTLTSVAACGSSSSVASGQRHVSPTASPATSTVTLTPLATPMSICMSPVTYKTGVWEVAYAVHATTAVELTHLTNAGSQGEPDAAALLRVAPGRVKSAYATSGRNAATFMPAGVWAHRSPFSAAHPVSMSAGETGVLFFHVPLGSAQSYRESLLRLGYTTASGAGQVAPTGVGPETTGVHAHCSAR